MRSSIALAVSLLVFGFGCGESEDPPRVAGGGSGGEAGAAGGGSGGNADGGSGGDAGTGGSEEPRCGDSRRDPDEECDDGNTDDHDGCSSTCTTEGTCDAPLEWNQVATANGDGSFSLVSTFPLTHQGEPTRCTGTGRQLIIRYVPEHAGVLAVQFDESGMVSMAIRRECGTQSTEALCVLGRIPARMEVEADEELFIVLDAREETDEISVSLTVQLHPYRQEGERCNTQPEGTCAPGLTCDDISDKGRCLVNLPPVLENLVAYRGGPSGEDLVVVMSGGDPNGNAMNAIGFVFDQDGERVAVADRNFDGVPESYELPLPPNRNLGVSTAFEVSTSIHGFFVDFPQVTSLEAWLIDREFAASNRVQTGFVPQPRKSQGESCDWYTHRDLCLDGLRCAPLDEEHSQCRPLTELREERCLTAEPVTLGHHIEARFPDGTSRSSMSLWDAPLSCIDSHVMGSHLGQIEALAKLSLDEPLYNVVITTEVAVGSFDTVLYLMPGCGTTDEILACNDDAVEGRGPSRLTFDVLPPGEYLIVVDKRRQGGAHWDLLVTGDAEP